MLAVEAAPQRGPVPAQHNILLAGRRALDEPPERAARPQREHPERRPPRGQERVLCERVEVRGEVVAGRAPVEGAEPVEGGEARGSGPSPAARARGPRATPC